MKARASENMDELSSDLQPFRILVMFDSVAAGREAIHACDFVLNEIGVDLEAQPGFFQTSSLNDPAACTEAAEAAIQADLIILALSDEEQTEGLKAWAKQWQNFRRTPGLLAVIPTATESDSLSDLVGFFRETAISSNMDFLCREATPRF